MKIRPFQIERFFARYEFKAPYLLSSSDCEALTVQQVLDLEEGAAEQFQHHWLGYTESPGSSELRKAITTLYQSIDEEQILVHAGAEEAIFTFMNAVLEKDDHIIVHFPCYQSLFEVANAIGCEVTHWETHEENGWELDLASLRQSIKKNTKAIVINCPHNPTGYLMSKVKQQQIIEIAREHQCIIFSDEVYRGLEQNADEILPAACDLYEHAVSLGVMSKTFGLPGLRIGWIATRNPQIYASMEAYKDYLTICNSAPSEFLATVALRNKAAIIARNKHIIDENMRLLISFFTTYQHLFSWIAPKAGSIAFPRILFEQDSEQFCTDVVQKQGVLLLPGTCYDFGQKHFRIGFGRKNMPESLGQLENYVKNELPATRYPK
jgi:aspartate/methionine/tyrosine aminotransferase